VQDVAVLEPEVLRARCVGHGGGFDR
jgi:hypothetical protein